MCRSFCFRILILGFVALFSGKTMAQNLVTNGDFALSATGWTFFAPATGTEAYNPETSYGGTIGTNIIAEIDNGANLRQTNINVVPGSTYQLSFRRTRRTLGGAPNPTGVRVKVYNGTNIFLNQDVFSNNAAWNWTCESFTFVPNTNMVTLDFENITAVGSTLGTILDDITISPEQQVITLAGTICQGGTVTLQAPQNNGGATYTNFSWTGPNNFSANTASITFNNAQPAINGLYTCTMILNGCMEVSGTYNLQISPNNFTISANICTGSTYDFYGRTLYQPGTYDTLIISDNSICDSFITLQLQVNPFPDVSTSPAGKNDICLGDTLTLNVQNPATSVSYQWLNNNLIIPGETAVTYTTGQGGTYRLAAVTDKGCSDTSMAIEVEVHTPPKAGIRFIQDKPLCITDTLSVTAEEAAYYYLWEPQSLFRNRFNLSMDSKTLIALIKENETVIRLTVYDQTGCYSTDSLRITAAACCDLYIPDAFSPNGDGRNDYFVPVIDRGQVLLAFRIYDRWGKIVYTGNSTTDKGWNGSYPDGTIASSGIYMYYLQYTCGDSSLKVKKGDLTLIY